MSTKPPTRIQHLLKRNHTEYSILYNNYHFHNHTPHFLAAAYLLDASPEQLNAIYDDAVRRANLETWTSNSHPITMDNHRAHLGRGDHQHAWVDFFDEQTGGTDQWQSKVVTLLLNIGLDKEHRNSAPPLLHTLIADLGHPLIHLGYAFEVDSREVAIEALSLASACYDEQLAGLLFHPTRDAAALSTSNTATTRLEPTSALLEIFSRARSDETLPTFPHPGDANIPLILNSPQYTAAILAHVNSWTITSEDPILASNLLNDAHHTAALALLSTAPNLHGHGYDFFLVHILTTIHAVAALLPHLPTSTHVVLLRQWLLMSLLAYTAQQRPDLTAAKRYIEDSGTTLLQSSSGLEGWGFVRRQALEGEHASDAHFVKACQALIVAGERSDGEEGHGGSGDGSSANLLLLRCAVHFAGEFERWSGFPPDGERAEEARRHRIRDGIHV